MSKIMIDRIKKTKDLKPTTVEEMERWREKSGGLISSRYIDGDLMIDFRERVNYRSVAHFIGSFCERDRVYLEEDSDIIVYKDIESLEKDVFTSVIKKGHPRSFASLLKSADHISFDGEEVEVEDVDDDLQRIKILSSGEKSDIYEFARGFYKEDLKKQKAYDENWDEFWLDIYIHRM